jgi:hypothetical protein
LPWSQLAMVTSSPWSPARHGHQLAMVTSSPWSRPCHGHDLAMVTSSPWSQLAMVTARHGHDLAMVTTLPWSQLAMVTARHGHDLAMVTARHAHRLIVHVLPNSTCTITSEITIYSTPVKPNSHPTNHKPQIYINSKPRLKAGT